EARRRPGGSGPRDEEAPWPRASRARQPGRHPSRPGAAGRVRADLARTHRPARCAPDRRVTDRKVPAMPITSVVKDPEALTLTVVADFPVPVRRLWDAYADPRQIEKFWGPPGWPATFTRHDMAPGGRSTYVMTGPEGERSGGYWEFISVEAPRSFEVRDGFTRDDGTPNTDMPSMRMVFAFDETDAGSRLTT